MSATFKLAKQKHTQQELRRLMNEQKPKAQSSNTVKIESPLAKYNELGQLTCILCKSIVRSENVWKVHVNAKQHKQNIEAAKRLKEETNNFKNAPMKRPATPPPLLVDAAQPAKRIKGILKNSSTFLAPATSNITVDTVANKNEASANNSGRKSAVPSDFFDAVSKKPLGKLAQPGDFFEATLQKTSIRKDLLNIKKRESFRALDTNPSGEAVPMEEDGEKDEVLPEGFFDDPIKDAKARNLDYKDPVEEEWEKFQKEIKAAADFSNAIIAEDQEEATAERQIDEIDEQIRNWSRVLSLEKKKEVVAEKVKRSPVDVAVDVAIATDSDDENDEDFDEYLDWRAKRSLSKFK